MKPIRIAKGIPLPPPKGTGRSKYKRIFDAMNTGDSFLAPTNIGKCTAVFRQRYGVELQTRKVSATKCRIWLLSKP